MVSSSEAINKKVVLIGDTAVGKTCIFNRIISDQYTEDGITTMSAYFRTRIFDVPGYSQKLKVNLWDTAGQEKFKTLTKQYCQGADAAIVVYDCTFSESLEGAKSWIEELNESVDREATVLAVAGNKSDLTDEIQVNLQQGATFKKDVNAQVCMQVSAKENQGIEDLVKQLCLKLMQQHFKGQDGSGTTGPKARQTLKLKKQEQKAQSDSGKKKCCQ